MESISELREMGAHLVLLRDKQPFWKGWNKRKPGRESLYRHMSAGGEVGIIPESLHCSVVDVDEGNADWLLNQYPPLAVCPTRKGVHVWYSDYKGRGNQDGIRLGGLKMDIRSAKGQVRMHGQAPRILLDALKLHMAEPDQLSLFPEHLFAGPKTAQQLDIKASANNALRSRGAAETASYRRPASVPVGQASTGWRNSWLSRMLWRNAWGWPSEGLADACLAFARANTACLARPMSDGEVWDIAVPKTAEVLLARRSGATRARREFVQAQRRRAGLRWDRDGSDAAVEAKARRDAEIRELAGQGWPHRQLALRFDLTRQRISQIINLT